MLIRPVRNSSLRGTDPTKPTAQIVVPDEWQEPSRLGRVLRCGPKVCDVRPGDLVLFGRYSGLEFKRGEDREEWVGLRLIKESLIEAKLELTEAI